MLGLLPGSGGTQRLPPLIGLPDALTMMLMGAGKNAKQAKKLGLVDLVIKSLGELSLSDLLFSSFGVNAA